MGDEKLFQEAMAYFERNLDRNLLADELARELGASKATLFRCFQNLTGVGMHRYFLQTKIRMGTELLRQGLTVAETSERLGFGTPSYFSARYKRETGINPSEIKKDSL